MQLCCAAQIGGEEGVSYQIGVIGLAVMGKGLSLRLAELGFSVAGYNREADQTEDFEKQGLAAGYCVKGCESYSALCQVLERPRKLLLMVSAGAAVDEVLNELFPILEPGDVVIDGGNSHFRDTMRRQVQCATHSIYLLGMGVSGGEKGAREGAAFMLGGDRKAYELVAPFFQTISAKVAGQPCCAYVGPAGAGHFVKMVHNGIEYGDMQLICEIYYGMKRLLAMTEAEMAQQFQKWSQGCLSGYLTQITANILATVDLETGRPIVELIEGIAESKGTGMWAGQAALELGVVAPTLVQAVFARNMSKHLLERRSAAQLYSCPKIQRSCNRADVLELMGDSLYAARICTYVQGFSLLREASRVWDWKLDLAQIAKVFRGGCIIRTAFLETVEQAYMQNPQLENLLLHPFFCEAMRSCQRPLRELVIEMIREGLSAPALSSALAYFDGYRDDEGPMNLIQAQRDYFGAHMVERVDRTGPVHISWNYKK